MTKTTSRMRSLETCVQVSLETSLHLGRLLESLETRAASMQHPPFQKGVLCGWCLDLPT